MPALSIHVNCLHFLLVFFNVLAVSFPCIYASYDSDNFRINSKLVSATSIVCSMVYMRDVIDSIIASLYVFFLCQFNVKFKTLKIEVKHLSEESIISLLGASIESFPYSHVLQFQNSSSNNMHNNLQSFANSSLIEFSKSLTFISISKSNLSSAQ